EIFGAGSGLTFLQGSLGVAKAQVAVQGVTFDGADVGVSDKGRALVSNSVINGSAGCVYGKLDLDRVTVQGSAQVGVTAYQRCGLQISNSTISDHGLIGV